MSIYNTLRTDVVCPWCGERAEMEIDLYFGYRDLISYRIGDTCIWAEGRSAEKGGRPPSGNCAGEGYTECPQCGRDFFVTVEVQQDRIRFVKPDTSREPHIKPHRPLRFK